MRSFRDYVRHSGKTRRKRKGLVVLDVYEANQVEGRFRILIFSERSGGHGLQSHIPSKDGERRGLSERFCSICSLFDYGSVSVVSEGE